MKLLTPEEIAKLKESPYVVEATERYVYFNIEFKKKYYRAYQRGVKPTQILIDLGLDPQLLGTSRIYSIRTHVLKQAKGGRFTDKSDSAYRKAMKFLTPKEKIARLEHELAYTKQQLAFVKKILSANREAEKQWESKQAQQKNTRSSEK